MFLTVGDEVTHQGYQQWGMGLVVEVMTSTVPGGTCLARVRFQDGQLRTFNNDMDNELCCYFFGVRKEWSGRVLFEPERARRAPARRRLT